MPTRTMPYTPRFTMAADIRRGDRSRSLGMGAGQPDVQWNRTGLRPESDHREHEGGAANPLRHVRRAECDDGERLAPGASRQQHQAKDQCGRTELRHHRVPLTGHLHLAPVCMVGEDEEERRDRHQLPQEQERGHVGCGGDEQQGRHEQRQDARGRPAAETVTGVPQAKDQGADADDRADDDEKSSEAIEGEGKSRERHQGSCVHHGGVARVKDVCAHDHSEPAGADREYRR